MTFLQSPPSALNPTIHHYDHLTPKELSERKRKELSYFEYVAECIQGLEVGRETDVMSTNTEIVKSQKSLRTLLQRKSYCLMRMQEGAQNLINILGDRANKFEVFAEERKTGYIHYHLKIRRKRA
ncbi:hypothetical protein FJZ18_02615 [Candidatus Pacearchaeota archaeon]|nr:hypothetical protein [Candidatus Pacearchaeota archaeon]